mmetsp:Transcript_61764/g.125404  ORF Transcript_61764/g.125404 Transcript_61764/m.125404 type:complete len:366 (-) Transcript_61764:51-1148(-)
MVANQKSWQLPWKEHTSDTWAGAVAICAGGRQLVCRLLPDQLRRLSGGEVLVFEARPIKAVLHADVVVVLGQDKLVNARVQDLRQAGTLLGHGQGSPCHGVPKETCLDVGEGGAKASPEVAVPVGSHALGALVVFGLIRIDPHGIRVAVQQGGKRIIVCVGRCHGGLHHGKSCEALLGAFVLGQGQGISGGGPAHHVHHFQAIEVIGAVDDWNTILQAHKKASRFVVFQDGPREFHETIASTVGVGVGHAAMHFSVLKALADDGVAPAFAPLHLNHRHAKIADRLKAHGNVMPNACNLKVRLGRDPKIGIAWPIDVLSQDDLWLASPRHDARNQRFFGSIAHMVSASSHAQALEHQHSFDEAHGF